ncbi:hypothetical protein ACQP1K_24245 [Sphaerimonospora sp. CA-214678]|uniref:hypothetical protein n=1 Tax=Sphaerimonospora sp. CA-214678 TaxID=3240029 RepID=UPI003D8D46C4
MTADRTGTGPRIALISAVTAAMDPAAQALRAAFDTVDLWHLLDDRLLADAEHAGGVTPPLRERMNRLIAHAECEGADAVLLTCSLYGTVADSYRGAITVLAPDQAAFSEIARAGYRRVLIVASLPQALSDSQQRLLATLDAAGSASSIDGIVVDGAAEAAAAGDTVLLAQRISEAVRIHHSHGDAADALFLAQYSLAPARDMLVRDLAMPVLSGPSCSAGELRRRLRP